VQGLDYTYYEADPIDDLRDLQRSAIVRNGTADDFDISVRDRDENFGFRYIGYVEVPENGEYTFSTDSDDGSRLYIGDELAVDNHGLHATTEASGTVQLQDGRHAITYFEHTDEKVLGVRWSGPVISGDLAIPADRLYRNATPTADFIDARTGLSCPFDASVSAAPGSSIDSYRWNVGSDMKAIYDATLDYEFASEGTYDVNLTVTTTDGATARFGKTHF
jgi:PKD repeat protein